MSAPNAMPSHTIGPNWYFSKRQTFQPAGDTVQKSWDHQSHYDSAFGTRNVCTKCHGRPCNRLDRSKYFCQEFSISVVQSLWDLSFTLLQLEWSSSLPDIFICCRLPNSTNTTSRLTILTITFHWYFAFNMLSLVLTACVLILNRWQQQKKKISLCSDHSQSSNTRLLTIEYLLQQNYKWLWSKASPSLRSFAVFAILHPPTTRVPTCPTRLTPTSTCLILQSPCQYVYQPLFPVSCQIVNVSACFLLSSLFYLNLIPDSVQAGTLSPCGFSAPLI